MSQVCRELKYQPEVPLPSSFELQRLEENKVIGNCQLIEHVWLFVFLLHVKALPGVSDR